MDEQEKLIEMGDEAEILLANETFNKTVNTMVEQTFQTFVNTKYDEKDRRENAYLTYRSLVDIVHTLQQRVSVRDEIKQNRDTNEEE